VWCCGSSSREKRQSGEPSGGERSKTWEQAVCRYAKPICRRRVICRGMQVNGAGQAEAGIPLAGAAGKQYSRQVVGV